MNLTNKKYKIWKTMFFIYGIDIQIFNINNIINNIQIHLNKNTYIH